MTPDKLAGRLVLRPAAQPSVICERPMVGAALLRQLTQGRRAVLLPELLAATFTLCAHAQRSTARLAVRAALGLAERAADGREALALGLQVQREHLQRLALDLPSGAGPAAEAHAGGAPVASVQWLRTAPVVALPAAGRVAESVSLEPMAEAMPRWLERSLFGMPPAEWLAGWRAAPGEWLSHWCKSHEHPLTQWLRSVRDEASSITWPCHALQVLQAPAREAELRRFAAALAADPSFAERPRWHAAPAETGPWTRVGQAWPVTTVWERLGARLADLAGIALAPGQALAHGALAVAPGEGIAWTEMARGVLVHWVRLEAGEHDAGTARAERYHVIAPTEWNFHPEGAFAVWLAACAPRDAARVRLAAAALDPCLAFTIEQATRHA